MLNILQVDPSLFTAPYDVALSQGLRANGMTVRWATRGLRPGEEDTLASERVSPIFYPLSDGPRRRVGRMWQALKGVEHIGGLNRLVRMAADEAVDLVHFQWGMLPLFDRRAIDRIRRSCPVVLTVHDATPFNGKSVGRLQIEGYDALLGGVDHLIVHGEAGRRALLDRGLPPGRISVVPHGALPLPIVDAEARPDPERWRIVLFGRIQEYKGVDLAIEALGLLPPRDRRRIELIVAGDPMIPIDPICARARQLGLGDCLEFRPRRLGDAEMAALLRSADAFIFPYRAIEASGVLHLVADLKRWIIASDVGSFGVMIGPQSGELVPPADTRRLAAAIVRSVGRRPTAPVGQDIPDWRAIGAATLAVYERVIADYRRASLMAVAA